MSRQPPIGIPLPHMLTYESCATALTSQQCRPLHHWTSSLEMSNKISMHLRNMLSNAGPPFSMRVGNMPRLQIINCTLWDPVAPGAVHRCLIFPSAQTGHRSFTRTSDLVQVVYTCAQALGTNRPPNIPVTWFPVNILRPVYSQRLCAGVP